MKVLELRLFFKLPDDFAGTESDAIRLLAEYHEGTGKDNPNRSRSPGSIEGRTREQDWEEFLVACELDMFRVIGGIGLTDGLKRLNKEGE